MTELDVAQVPRLRVLVIEDNLPDVMLIQESLREAGYGFELTHYADGEEAVGKLTSAASNGNVFDLVILDINMPRISGLEVLSKLRADEAFDLTPILVLTSSLSPEEQTDALRLGASGFLKKSSDLYRFLSEVGEKVKEIIKQETSYE